MIKGKIEYEEIPVFGTRKELAPVVRPLRNVKIVEVGQDIWGQETVVLKIPINTYHEVYKAIKGQNDLGAPANGIVS